MNLQPMNPPARDGQRVYCVHCQGSTGAAFADLDAKAGTFYCEACARAFALGHMNKLAQLGERVLEILELDALPADFDAPDKIGAVRNAARDLGLLDGEEKP